MRLGNTQILTYLTFMYTLVGFSYKLFALHNTMHYSKDGEGGYATCT